MQWQAFSLALNNANSLQFAVKSFLNRAGLIGLPYFVSNKPLASYGLMVLQPALFSQLVTSDGHRYRPEL